MFKRLYRVFLLQNIGIISLLLLLVFSGLYFSTYFDVTSTIDREFDNIEEAFVIYQDGGPNFNRLNRQIFFIVEYQDGEPLIEQNQIMIEPSTVLALTDGADSDEGTVTYDNQVWNYDSFKYEDTTYYVFMNTTLEHELLHSTLQRFGIIYILSILLTTLISSIITRRSIRPVKESFDKQRQFVSDASHELKTPLTVINTNVDILISEDTTDNKWLRYIKSEVDRMSKLTHDLLYLSKMTEQEQNKVYKSRFDVSDLVESISLSLDALAYEKGITLNTQIDEGIEIEFNKEQFHQVAMILIDNAIKYTNKKGSIDIVLKSTSQGAVFNVTNTGKGIPESDLPHIFDRFYKVDKSREETSNSFGLGLPIAKSICDNHHVKLSVDSVENQDTTFSIKLKTI